MSETVAPVYRHTQHGVLGMAALSTLALGAIIGSLLVRQPALLVVGVGAGVLALLFSSLTTVVAGRHLRVAFGVGLIRRTIDLTGIRDVRVVRTPWYYGWGIRWTPYGWLWNIAGLGGIELEFSDGHRFRIGSDEPEVLAGAVRQQIGR